MSNLPSSSSPQTESPGARSAAPPDRPFRPGWPEIAVGLVALAAVGLGVGWLLGRLSLDPMIYGLSLTALSGFVGIAAFAAAAALRIRTLGAFGVRRTTWRWILIGAGAGVVAFVLKTLAIWVWIQIFGEGETVQAPYAAGGSGGVLSLILATAFISLLTPLGEELLFRGVITNALLRYGPIIGVVGSSLIFAVTHGLNTVFPAALVVGLITAEIYRRSGSVWPGVVVHAVHNLPTVPFLVAAAG